MKHLTTATVGVMTSVALTTGVTGCTTGDAASPPSDNKVTTAEAPTAAPETTSPTDQAIELAQAVVQEYYRVSDASLQNPAEADVRTYEKVASGSALHGLRNMRTRFVSNGWTQVGQSTLEVVEVGAFDLNNNPDADPPVIPTGELSVCIDSSGFDIVGKDGNSVEGPDAPEHRFVRIGVANYDYPDGPWTVAFTEFKADKTC